MSKKATRKVAKVLAMAMAAMLTIQNTSMVANAAVTTEAASMERQYVISCQDKFIEIGNTGEDQKLELIKGKTYIFSYPIFNRGGLKFTSIEYRAKDGSWKKVDLLDMLGGNEDLIAHVCQQGPGRMLLKLICMTDGIGELKTRIKDEITGEVYEFSAEVEVQESQDTDKNVEESLTLKKIHSMTMTHTLTKIHSLEKIQNLARTHNLEEIQNLMILMI